MSEFIEVTEDVTIIETDDEHVEVIESSSQAVTELSQALSAHKTDTGNPHAVTKAQVGLGSVDNTSDASKPVSTAQQAALDGKADFPTTNQRIPVRSSTGTQSSERFDQAVTAFSIPQQTTTGTIKAAAATSNDDLTTKAQMEAADAQKANKAGTRLLE